MEPGGKSSIGEFIVRKVKESGVEGTMRAVEDLWAAHRNDATYDFGLWEYIKAAGRLAQGGSRHGAIATLDLAIRLHGDGADPEDVAALHSQVSELYLGEGDRPEALQRAQKAIGLNKGDTAAAVLSAYLEEKG
jgi:tetratricopeptide (TPR) repeat protein